MGKVEVDEKMAQNLQQARGSVIYLLKVAGSKLCLFIKIRIINKEYFSVGWIEKRLRVDTRYSIVSKKERFSSKVVRGVTIYEV